MSFYDIEEGAENVLAKDLSFGDVIETESKEDDFPEYLFVIKTTKIREIIRVDGFRANHKEVTYTQPKKNEAGLYSVGYGENQEVNRIGQTSSISISNKCGDVGLGIKVKKD